MSPKGFDLRFGQFLTFWPPIASGIGVWALHNLNIKANVGFDPSFPFPPIAAIGKQMQLHVRLLLVQLQKELLAACTIRDIGSQHLHVEQQAQGIYNKVVLASVDFFATIVARRPPFWEVFTLRESTMPALGTVLRPLATRT